jgi:hypothetical protein
MEGGVYHQRALFEPTVMFFGLTNFPATFQTMMNSIFANEIAEKWLTVYMDNMAIHTKRQPGETEEQHVQWHRMSPALGQRCAGAHVSYATGQESV